METRHGIKYRQLHIEDYLREIPAEQGRVTGVYAHEWITGNPDTNTDFWTDNLLDTILRSDNLNAAYSYTVVFTGFENLGSQKCWLKGTVTGSDNDISVTWSM